MSNRCFDIRVKSLEKNSTHHIVPKSRGGDASRKNLAKVNRMLHEKYHSLFENRTPEEIIQSLNSYFWRKKYNIAIVEK